MVFEIEERDLAGRTGVLKTRRGEVETPCLMPVINPVKNLISPRELKEKFRFKMIITNAYLILKHFGKDAPDVHSLTGFEGAIMTDSGAYQLLIYGGVETSPQEIVEFQEKIGSDIGVILDTPTGGFASRADAERTVEETIRRAKTSFRLRKDPTMLWAGPIQGGKYLDLIRKSAKEMGKMDFHTHPLGSPVQIMEGYDYTTLVDMIVTAKRNLPPNRPLHLFGAGHPMMLALAVALGCDLFDSAAYALFAKDDRYLTTRGTFRLERLSELPCSCPVCSQHDQKDLLEMPKLEREEALARHNLYATAAEMRAIRQALREGGLWELVEARCRTHPRLYEGFKRLGKYAKYLEENDPVVGKGVRGVFIYDRLSLRRPEVLRHRHRVVENYARPPGKDIGVFIPNPQERPFVKSKEYQEARAILEGSPSHICFYGEPFGVVPSELSETFPLSQYEYTPGSGINIVAEIRRFIDANAYRKVYIVDPSESIFLKGTITLESITQLRGQLDENLA
ncbi:MAG: tRNA guanosine(15) transglycosylase TgtA [Candidatus Verstraetearchaeota archaeon]|nr:tRNA guanosine(15) transglycosylase TgtA [Candidatus Verstraetearchaeota archaeon]